MNRRMAKAESARKFHAAVLRCDRERTAILDGWLRDGHIDQEARAAAEHPGFGLDTAWLDEMADATQAFQRMGNAAREAGQAILAFGEAKPAGIDPRWLTPQFPFDPWPCGRCSVRTERQHVGKLVGGNGDVWVNVPTAVVTCAECRDLGAPDTMPYR